MWQYNNTPEPNELYHHGIKGMHWGKRRYQNTDGSLTPAGKKRYRREVERSPEVRAAKQAHKERQKRINNEYARARAEYEMSGPLMRRKSAAYDRMVKTGDKYRAETQRYKKELDEARKTASAKEGTNTKVSKGMVYTTNVLAGTAGGTLVGLSYARQHNQSGLIKTKTILAGSLSGAALGTISGKQQIKKS